MKTGFFPGLPKTGFWAQNRVLGKPGKNPGFHAVVKTRVQFPGLNPGKTRVWPKTRFWGPKLGFGGTREKPGFAPKPGFWAPKPGFGGTRENPVLAQNRVSGPQNRVLGQNWVSGQNRVFPGFAQNPVLGPEPGFGQTREKTRFSCRGQNPGSIPGFKPGKNPGLAQNRVLGPKTGF